MPFATKAIRDRARRRIAQRVRAGEPCTFCGLPIDLSLKYPHRDSFVVDHRIATVHGGADHDQPGQGGQSLRPAHNWCNRQRGSAPDGSVGRNSGALG